jgi:hypothetical protein
MVTKLFKIRRVSYVNLSCIAEKQRITSESAPDKELLIVSAVCEVLDGIYFSMRAKDDRLVSYL